jgi:hypothetical protein
MLNSNTKLGEVFTPTPPGISWTADPKSRPWLRPPQETDVVKIANAYIDMLGNTELMNDVLDALDTKTPLAVIAEVFVMKGVGMGRHTLDAAVLVMPVVIEVLKTIAALNKIEVVTFPKELEKGMTVHPRILKKVINDMTQTVAEQATPVAEQEESPKGLMSRMKKEGV